MGQSSATRKAEYGHGVDSPSRIMAVGADLQNGGLSSSKSKIVGTSEMVRGSEREPRKMKGTSIDSSNLDSLEATATAILQQNWRGGKTSGEIHINSETLFLRSTFTLPIKTLSAAPSPLNNSLEFKLEVSRGQWPPFIFRRISWCSYVTGHSKRRLYVILRKLR